jgi:hypothetical protein
MRIMIILSFVLGIAAMVMYQDWRVIVLVLMAWIGIGAAFAGGQC